MLSNSWFDLWYQDNLTESKQKKNYEVQFSINLNIENKLFKNNNKINNLRHFKLSYQTCDLIYDTEIT
jgi:hypothetical protein